MTKPCVGVLGGMGPEATILLQQRVLALVQAADDSDHIPLLIDMNPQVPSRIAHLIDGSGQDPGPTLAHMAQRLQTAGATALAMPCNTAHHYATSITKAVTIPFLNMVDLSIARVANTDQQTDQRIGLLASPAVKLAGVFDPAVAHFGMQIFWPQDLDQMLTAIRLIKAQGPTPKARDILTAAAEELAQAGVTQLLVACSEFSMMAQDLPDIVPVLDTVDVLADAIHAHACPTEAPPS